MDSFQLLWLFKDSLDLLTKISYNNVHHSKPDERNFLFFSFI